MPPASRGLRAAYRRWNRVCSCLTSRHYTTVKSPKVSAATPFKIHLRQYQEECIQTILSHLAQGHKRLGVSLATGAGKTVIFSHLIDRIKPRNEIAKQTLILAHRQELVEQAARHCSNAYPKATVEIEMGNMHASGRGDITVASVQSIISGGRMEKFHPSRFKLVLVDEAHHIVAPGYMKTLKHFGLSKPQPDSPALVGVSATMSRFDGLRLGAAIDRIVYHKDYIDMIGEKWLSDVIFTTVHSKADISGVKPANNGDFRPAELSQVVNTEQVNELTVRSWLAKAEGRKSTLVFCVDLAHVTGLTNTFRSHGIDARFVTGDTPRLERSKCLDCFKKGEFPVLVNCGVFTEGTDIPNIDCVLLARPTKSRNLLVQMIGRGMRLHPGKKNCHIIDMVASLETGIVSTPTLFGLDPSELIESASVSDMRSSQDRKLAEEIRNQKSNDTAARPEAKGQVNRIVTFTDYETVFDLIQDTSGERHIRTLSPNAWVCVDRDRYILTNSNGSHLKLEKVKSTEGSETQHVVTETVTLSPTISKAPYRRPRTIAEGLTFADALRAADTYAKKKYPFPMISRNQAWRNGPATEGQIIFLNKLRPKSEQLTINDLTKGAAGDMITKIKHGARGRFAALDADKRRFAKANLKIKEELAMRSRETVTVGPLET